MKVISAQLLLEQPKKTKMKKHVAAKKCAFCQSEQDQSSDADLARVELDRNVQPARSYENQNIDAATAELNSKYASATLIHNANIKCSQPSLKAWACDFRVGLNSGQMSVPVPFSPPPKRTVRAALCNHHSACSLIFWHSLLHQHA